MYHRYLLGCLSDRLPRLPHYCSSLAHLLLLLLPQLRMGWHDHPPASGPRSAVALRLDHARSLGEAGDRTLGSLRRCGSSGGSELMCEGFKHAPLRWVWSRHCGLSRGWCAHALHRRAQPRRRTWVDKRWVDAVRVESPAKSEREVMTLCETRSVRCLSVRRVDRSSSRRCEGNAQANVAEAAMEVAFTGQSQGDETPARLGIGVGAGEEKVHR